MSEAHTLRNEWDGVVEIVFNRPAKLNALSRETFGALLKAVEDLRKRPDLRVMLIRSQGRYFSAGADLSEDDKMDFQNSAMRAREWMRHELKGGMHELYEQMEKVEKPIVVAHQAMCVGGGLEMSLSCDFRLAAASAGYWFPEMQLGILPLSNGTARLTRLVGQHWAKWMVLANEKVTAQEALNMGLVHKIYPDETFEEDVKSFCRKLAGFPAEVIATGKLIIEMAHDLGPDQQKQLERLAFSSLTFAPRRDETAGAMRKKMGGA